MIHKAETVTVIFPLKGCAISYCNIYIFFDNSIKKHKETIGEGYSHFSWVVKVIMEELKNNEARKGHVCRNENI